ncbi:hypothetical protein D3C71_1339280 [compost metagenome]
MLTGEGIEVAQPAFLITAFGKGVTHSHALGKLAADFVDTFRLELRLDHLVRIDEVRHVGRLGIQTEIRLFGGGEVRQQDIGVFRGRGHVVIDHHDHFARLVILQDLMGPVDI